MESQTKFVAISNQKGGIGKSAFTVLLASYFHYLKGKNVLVVDCDYPHFSIHSLREREKQTISKNETYKQMLVSQFEQLQNLNPSSIWITSLLPSRLYSPTEKNEILKRLRVIRTIFIFCPNTAKMAQEAVCANAYCLQLVPNELMTIDLCKQALQNPEADKKVLGFIPERIHNNPEIRKMAEEKFGDKKVEKEISTPEKKKSRSVS